MNRRAQPWLGTLVDITADCAQSAIDAAFAEVALVHRLMSFHDPASDVSRLNRVQAGEVVAVHRHTWQVLRLAEQLAEASHGLFNPACAPHLVATAHLPSPAPDVPPLRALREAFFCADESAIRKLQPAWLDLGGIAKGYAVDLAVDALRQAGATHVCVNAGGDLRVFGERYWPAFLRDPVSPSRMHSRLTLRQEALATSAIYFSSKSHEGQRVSALFDGRDGKPLNTLHSVSVRAPTCAVADALTKVVMASGAIQHPCLEQWRARAIII